MASDVVTSKMDLARLAVQAHEIEYEIEADDRLAVAYGSARLTIIVRRAVESTVMRVSACVLDELSVEDELELRLLRSLNERNRTLPYGKFFCDQRGGQIIGEYELLGGHLQDFEFMNALTTFCRLADDHDDL